MQLSALDHVGVAVEDIDAALAVYRDALGMPLVHRETVSEQGVDAALLDVGDSHIELLQPLGPETPVGKFLARKGPGLHHVAYRVASVQDTLDALTAAGVRLIDERPRTGIRGSQVAFIHPSQRAGCSPKSFDPEMADDKPQKISIGFDGGQVLGARVQPDELANLRKALGSMGWHELTAEDGTVALDLSRVLYVLVDHEDHRVGFGQR